MKFIMYFECKESCVNYCVNTMYSKKYITINIVFDE